VRQVNEKGYNDDGTDKFERNLSKMLDDFKFEAGLQEKKEERLQMVSD